jgi:homocysteine S-methyltransferase
MRLSPLPFASILKERFGIEPLVNISCRDRNLIALQGDLLAGWAAGIRSVIALTGDAVTIGDAPETKGVFEVNSVGLLGVIAKLNSGTDWVGNPLKGAPGYVAGVVVNPNARNPAAEVKRLLRKVEAGAKYALSQPVFDLEASRSFFTQAQAAQIPILMGLMAVRSKAAVSGLENIPGIKVPEVIKQRAAEASEEEDLSEFFIQHAIHLAKGNKGVVAGYHVISGTTPKLGMTLLGALVREFK